MDRQPSVSNTTERARMNRRQFLKTMAGAGIIAATVVAGIKRSNERADEYGSSRKSILMEYSIFYYITSKSIEDKIKQAKTKNEVTQLLNSYKSDHVYNKFIQKYLKDKGTDEQSWINSLNPNLN